MSDEFRTYAAKEYMRHITTLRNKVRAQQEQIDAKRLEIAGLKAMTYSDMPGSPNAYGDAIPDGIAMLEDMVRAYTTDLLAWVDEQHHAHLAIMAIDDGRHSELLCSHYLLEKSWEQIAVDMSYSYEYVRKELFEAALESLYVTMPEEWRRNFPNAI